MLPAVSVTFDAESFSRDVRAKMAGLPAVARQALSIAADVAVRDARATSWFKDRTGALRKSIRRENVSEFRIRVRADTPYAGFVNYGTRPHRIEATNAQALRFVIAGTVMFRRSVNHPGTKPTHFMEHAAQEGDMAFQRAIAIGLQRLFGG